MFPVRIDFIGVLAIAAAMSVGHQEAAEGVFVHSIQIWTLLGAVYKAASIRSMSALIVMPAEQTHSFTALKPA